MNKGNIWLICGGATLGILLVVSVVVALMESEERFAQDTPEGTVQSLLRFIEADDFQSAYTLLSADLKKKCSVEQIFGQPMYYNDRSENSRITHEDTATIDSTTLVTVKVSGFRNPGPFGTPGYHSPGLYSAAESSYLQRYSLRQEDGYWRFVQYPWPLSPCGPMEIATPMPVVVEPTPVPTQGQPN